MSIIDRQPAPAEAETSVQDVKNMTVDELSRLFLADFGGIYTEKNSDRPSFVNNSMLSAQELYLSGTYKDLLDDKQKLLEYRSSFESSKEFNQSLGIIQDFQILEKSWESYTLEQQLSLPSHDSTTPHTIDLYSALGKTPKYASPRQRELAQSYFSQDLWKQPMKMLDVSSLIEIAGKINLETILIEASHTLAQLHSTPYKSPETYEAAYRSEAFLAPLCEVIGFDGLAMALRSTVACIELRNTGKGEYVDLAEQLLSKHQEGRSENGEHCHDQLQQDVQSIMRRVVGENSHELVIGSESSHGVVFGDGECHSGHRELRLVWRLKSVGSLARKLAREASEKQNKHTEIPSSEVLDDQCGYVEAPLDIVGVTLIAHNRGDLIATYADIFRRMLPLLEREDLSNEGVGSIQPYPSPSRKCSFHIEGDAQFISAIKQTMDEQFPDRLNKISFRLDDKKGFRVAKMTGFYTSIDGVVPFEVQLLTEEDRRTARVGTAAHIFFKLSKQLNHGPTSTNKDTRYLSDYTSTDEATHDLSGHASTDEDTRCLGDYTPTDEDVYGLEQINQRKQYLGDGGLCKSSYDRVNTINRTLDNLTQLNKGMGNIASSTCITEMHTL